MTVENRNGFVEREIRESHEGIVFDTRLHVQYYTSIGTIWNCKLPNLIPNNERGSD